MAKMGKEDGGVNIAVRLDNDAVAWLDHIARGALTDRSTVCAVLFAMYVDRAIGAHAEPIAQSLAPAVDGHVTRAPEVSAPLARAESGKLTTKAEKWITAPEAALRTGLNVSTIWNNITKGTLKSKKVGVNTLILAESLARANIKPRAKRTKKKATKRKPK